MKITPNASNALSQAQTPAAQSQRAPVAPPAEAPSSAAASSSIALSNAAQTLQPSRSDSDGVDSAKIEQIKAAIATGQLQINPEAIAHAMIASARELVAAGQK